MSWLLAPMASDSRDYDTRGKLVWLLFDTVRLIKEHVGRHWNANTSIQSLAADAQAVLPPTLTRSPSDRSDSAVTTETLNSYASVCCTVWPLSLLL